MLLFILPSMPKNYLDDLHAAVSGAPIGFAGVVVLQDSLIQELVEFDRKVCQRQVDALLCSSTVHCSQPHLSLSSASEILPSMQYLMLAKLPQKAAHKI